MNNTFLYMEASLQELKRGYMEKEDQYMCVCCGYQVEKGIVYPEGGLLYEASRYIRLHVEREHGSVLDFLLSLDKSMTGLSGVQRNLLALFARGMSDTEIQKQLGIGSPSTIRNHRFVLREKMRQARLFLAAMELAENREAGGAPLQPHSPSPSPNRSRASRPSSAEERNAVLHKYFPQGFDGPLKSFSMKEKNKLLVLAVLADRFEYGRRYTEREVNDLLEPAYPDYALLRRYLVDYGFLDRKGDGSEYWRRERGERDKKEMQSVNRRDELKRMAKEIKIEAGVYVVKNNRNGKVWVESSPNLKNMNGLRFQLEMGSHLNKALQQDWNEFGADAFEFQVVELLKKKETGYFDEKEELKKLKAKWLEQLQPYGERGYNPPPSPE